MVRVSDLIVPVSRQVIGKETDGHEVCPLYTFDAADEPLCLDLCALPNIKKYITLLVLQTHTLTP